MKLHIGGKILHKDWDILNAIPSPGVDYVENAKDSIFSQNFQTQRR